MALSVLYVDGNGNGNPLPFVIISYDREGGRVNFYSPNNVDGLVGEGRGTKWNGMHGGVEFYLQKEMYCSIVVDIYFYSPIIPPLQ